MSSLPDSQTTPGEIKPLPVFSSRHLHPAAATSMIMPTRQAFYDFPRHLPKQQYLAALRLYVGVGGFAGGEGGEVGVVHWAEGF